VRLLQLAGDARADTLRIALDSVFADPAYRWASREDPLGPVRRAWMALGDALRGLRQDNPWAFEALLWVLVALLLAVLAHAAWVTVRTVRGGGRGASEVTMATGSAVRDASWYAREAARLAAGGAYVAAMQADFLRLVLELDGRRLVAFHPSKTPSEYAREPALGEAGRRALRELVARMYGHAFARFPLDREGYEAWRREAQVDRYGAAT
jgi:hypothetical protein